MTKEAEDKIVNRLVALEKYKVLLNFSPMASRAMHRFIRLAKEYEGMFDLIALYVEEKDKEERKNILIDLYEMASEVEFFDPPIDFS